MGAGACRAAKGGRGGVGDWQGRRLWSIEGVGTCRVLYGREGGGRLQGARVRRKEGVLGK